MKLNRGPLLPWIVDLLCVFLILCTLYISYAAWGVDGLFSFFYRGLSGVRYREMPMLVLATFIPALRPKVVSTSARIHHLPNADWIRLCKIKNATDGGFDLMLEQYLFKEAPPYRALSYTWGPAEGVAEDDMPFEKIEATTPHAVAAVVPKNVIRALHQLRAWSDESYFWIDSVCINQMNPREQSEQVNMMDQIYSRATAVDVWLGRSNDDTRRVIDVLEYLSGMGKRFGNFWFGVLLPERGRLYFPSSSILLPDEDWQALESFCSRRLFHRLWTLQEYALARDVRIIWGPHTLNAHVLEGAALFLSSTSLSMDLKYGRSDVAGAAITQRMLLRKLVMEPDLLQNIPLPYIRNPEYEAILAWVYLRSAATFASDPRDYVYGILGVTHALMDRLSRRADREDGIHYSPIKADYGLSVGQVFQMFTVRLMHGAVGVRAIALIQPGPRWEFQSRQRASGDLKLPSCKGDPSLCLQQIEPHRTFHSFVKDLFDTPHSSYLLPCLSALKLAPSTC